MRERRLITPQPSEEDRRHTKSGVRLCAHVRESRVNTRASSSFRTAPPLTLDDYYSLTRHFRIPEHSAAVRSANEKIKSPPPGFERENVNEIKFKKNFCFPLNAVGDVLYWRCPDSVARKNILPHRLRIRFCIHFTRCMDVQNLKEEKKTFDFNY